MSSQNWQVGQNPDLDVHVSVEKVALLPGRQGKVYSQVAFEVMEKKSADTNQGMFPKRNLVPRLILCALKMIPCGFFASMLPFFGDISSVGGAIGFIRLDLILPMQLYNMTYKRSKSSWTYWIDVLIIVVLSVAGLLGACSLIRELILDAKQLKLFGNNKRSSRLTNY